MIEVEDCSRSIWRKETMAMFILVEACGLSAATRDRASRCWTPDLWTSKHQRRYAREHHGRA